MASSSGSPRTPNRRIWRLSAASTTTGHEIGLGPGPEDRKASPSVTAGRGYNPSAGGRRSRRPAHLADRFHGVEDGLLDLAADPFGLRPGGVVAHARLALKDQGAAGPAAADRGRFNPRNRLGRQPSRLAVPDVDPIHAVGGGRGGGP